MSPAHTVANADSIRGEGVPSCRDYSVLIVSESADGKGGASLAALRSASVLRRAGLDVALVAATGPVSDLTTEYPISILEDGLDLIKAPKILRATRGIWNLDAARSLAKILDPLDPKKTIIHCHSFQFQLTASVLQIALKKGFPIVVTSHDYGLGCPYGGFYNYNEAATCPHKGLSLGCASTLCNESKSIGGKSWHFAKAALQRRITHRISHYAFVSEFSRRVLTPYLPAGSSTWVIPNPVSFPKEPPRKLRSDSAFLFVGRPTHEKGPLTFARAAAELNVKARFVGSGPLEAQIAAEFPNAELCGWKPQEEVRNYLAEARALIFPSQCLEGQPLVVQEAQSLGLPVVTSDACAAVDSIRDGVTGFTFRSGNHNDLAEKMKLLLDDDLACKQGLAAWDDYWHGELAETGHLLKTLNMYDEVVAALPGHRKP